MGELNWDDDDDSTVTYNSACTTCEKCDVRLRLFCNLLRYKITKQACTWRACRSIVLQETSRNRRKSLMAWLRVIHTDEQDFCFVFVWYYLHGLGALFLLCHIEYTCSHVTVGALYQTRPTNSYVGFRNPRKLLNSCCTSIKQINLHEFVSGVIFKTRI